MIMIYRGNNKKELFEIEQAMNKHGICYDKTLYFGFKNLLTKARGDCPYFQGDFEEIFEIRVYKENELLGKKILEELFLSHPVLSVQPSIRKTLFLIIGSILFFLFFAMIVIYTQNLKPIKSKNHQHLVVEFTIYNSSKNLALMCQIL